MHLGGRTVNLRSTRVPRRSSSDDPDLHAAHRERQADAPSPAGLLPDPPRARARGADVIANRAAPEAILRDEARASIQEIRDIDRTGTSGAAPRCTRRSRSDGAASERPRDRRPHRGARRDREAGATRSRSAAATWPRSSTACAVRHREARGRQARCFAWCGGAMAVSERVVLFHDCPPQGPARGGARRGARPGRGRGVLPQPEDRLRLDDSRAHAASCPRRFAPATCLALPARSRITWLKRGPKNPSGVLALRDDGTHTKFEVSGAGGIGS